MILSIKIEKRGKYGGTKIHLDPEVCQDLLDATEVSPKTANMIFAPFGAKVALMIKDLLTEEPDLLLPRSQTQIDAELQEEMKKAEMKLARGKAGGKWDEAPTSPLISVFPNGTIQMVYKRSFAEYSGWGEFLGDAMLPPGPITIRLIH